MLVSLEWLNELVDIKDIDPQKIAHELTMSGLEVEEIEFIKPKFSKVYTGKIIAIRPHPNADKIQLPTVDYGFGQQEVVCGAPNISVGQIIAFAIEGATVFNKKEGTEFILKKAKIRGFESSGMICSSEELCLEDDEFKKFSGGIIVLNALERFANKEIKLGVPLDEFLNLHKDIVLHTAPTANRGDLLSMRGVANELSAIFNRPINKPSVHIESLKQDSSDPFNVMIIDPDTCKYYSVGIVKNIKIRKSPDWMVKRLEASGVRSISNIVDITNYVMLEFGQPLHAFDLEKLLEPTLHVRRANDKEQITTLDNITRVLTTECILIATPTKPVAIAGLMGDISSEIDEYTKNLVIESAYFTPSTNRKSSRAVGLRTEACSRFERGVDIKTVKLALKRAIDLLVEFADAEFKGFYEDGSDEIDQVIIKLRFNQIKRILGIDISKDKILEILKNLDFELIRSNESEAEILVPSYRICDVNREIDLIEEISRIYGYDNIPETLPKKTQVTKLSDKEVFIELIKSTLFGNGFNEVITSSLVGYPLLNWCNIPINEELAIKVTNPQSEEYTMLRQRMIPSILQVVKYNIDRDIKDLNIFEIGKNYFINGVPTDKDPATKETIMLSAAVTGNILNGKWHTKASTDFYYIKGFIEALLEVLNLSKRVELRYTNEISFLHPGRSAYIEILGKPSSLSTPIIGFIGQINPRVISDCKLNQEIYVFELDLDALFACLGKSISFYKQVPQFPSVIRDIAFLINENYSNAEITKVIKKAGTNLLKNIELFDVYKGKNVPEGLKSLAFHLTLQDLNSTLTEVIVDREVDNIKKALLKALNVTFR